MNDLELIIVVAYVHQLLIFRALTAGRGQPSGLTYHLPAEENLNVNDVLLPWHNLWTENGRIPETVFHFLANFQLWQIRKAFASGHRLFATHCFDRFFVKLLLWTRYRSTDRQNKTRYACIEIFYYQLSIWLRRISNRIAAKLMIKLRVYIIGIHT